jgi:putative N6-adenine-specific DNA methylase
MQETLAAACVKISGWDGDKPLWDPMCGSGTLVAEAAMAYCRIPSGYLRKRFGFEALPEFDQSLWRGVRETCDKNIRSLPQGRITGSDISGRAVEAARTNLAQLPFGDRITIRNAPFDTASDFEDGVIITNPPYGKRLGTEPKIRDLYKRLGDFLKNHCSGTTAWVLGEHKVLRKYVGLKPSRKFALTNAKIRCELLMIESFKGFYRDQATRRNLQE